jgi:hypothetical protein
VGKWPAAATATGLAAAGHLSTAVVIADLRVGFGRPTSTETEDRTMTDASIRGRHHVTRPWLTSRSERRTYCTYEIFYGYSSRSNCRGSG